MQKLFFFEVINRIFSVRNEFDKVVLVGGNNTAGIGGRSPQPLEAKGDRGRSPWHRSDFLHLFPKNTHF